jgi:hypothetical protein
VRQGQCVFLFRLPVLDLLGKHPFDLHHPGVVAFKPRAEGMSVAEAEAAFWERYEERFTGIPKRRLFSPKGREYVKLRLEEWCER